MSEDSISNSLPVPQNPNRGVPFKFDDRIRCVLIKDEPYWSVLDTYKYYGNSSNPTRDWQRDFEELKQQGFNLPNLVEYVFVGSDGKNTRATPVANLRTFMRIAQVAKFKEWEPLRMRMANLMADLLEQTHRRDPQWVQVYEGEKISHTLFMDALEEAVWFICRGYHYTEATDAVFKTLYDRTQQEIKDEMGIGHKWQLEPFQSRYALRYQGIAKDIAMERLGERSELSFEEAKDIIRMAAELIGPQVAATSKGLGRDIATNLPLLNDGTY